MKRKVLLVEPNYSNKYPPMGLMKIATYFRDSGDDVIFFKGNLKDLVIELDVDDLIEKLNKVNAKVNWLFYKADIINYFKTGKISILEEIDDISNDVIALEMIKMAKRAYKNEDYFENPRFDFVGITTLFTFYFDITIQTINFAKRLCKDPTRVMVGGIMSSILPDKIYEETGIYPFVGQLDRPGIIDKDDNRIIDELPLDYSIIEEVDYNYPAKNAYYAYMTRGCINNCKFCAVPTLEPNYKSFISIKDQLEITEKRFGAKKDLLLLDNNALASDDFPKIIEEIKECGFEKGAKLVPTNQYDITINNLKDSYNDRAYIRKAISIYQEIMEKLPENEQGEFYSLLEKNGLLNRYTATKEAILSLEDEIRLLYEKVHFNEKGRARTIDFNQGMDARLVTDENMKLLSTICIKPLRIAFDHWNIRETYEAAIRTAVNNGITHLSNYMLYNFEDEPKELYYRMKLNVELCEELNATIYSFPMKYHPIDNENYFMNRDYVGKHWNRKFIRAVQAVLNSTKGGVGRGLDFFYEAFGKDEKRFETILWMPESFIIYRMKFKNTLAKEWEEKFWALPKDKLEIVQNIVSENKFSNIEKDSFDEDIWDVLKYYKITRDMAAKM